MKLFQKYNFIFHVMIAVILIIFITGCGAKKVDPLTSSPVTRSIEDNVKKDVDYVSHQAYDPWEGFNRGMYTFNAKFDNYVFLPIVNGYKFIMPDFAEKGVSNFFNNINEVFVFANSLLQFKGKKSVNTLGRFVINSTVGIAGLIDVATSAGIAAEDEDFGQTLGHYGFGPGPYMVLPILGPSNLRDATGTATKMAAFYFIDPFNFDDNSEWGIIYSALNSVDTRNQIYNFRYYDTGSPFEYEMIRMMYEKSRQVRVEN